MDRYLAYRGLSPVTLSACPLLAASVMLAIVLTATGAQTPLFTVESVAARSDWACVIPGCRHSHRWSAPSFPDGDPIGSLSERMGSSGREETR